MEMGIVMDMEIEAAIGTEIGVDIVTCGAVDFENLGGQVGIHICIGQVFGITY